MAQIGAEAAAGSYMMNPPREIPSADENIIGEPEDGEAILKKPESEKPPKPPAMAYRKTSDYAKVRAARKR